MSEYENSEFDSDASLDYDSQSDYDSQTQNSDSCSMYSEQYYSDSEGDRDAVPESKRLRAIVATCNNYDMTDELQGCEFALKHCSYAIIGREKGKQGTPHLQCYFEIKGQLSRKQVREFLNRYWFDKRKGTPLQAANYIKLKPHADFQEWGVISKQGKRTDLESFATAILAGETDLQLVEAWPGHCLRFARHIQSLRNMNSQPSFVLKNVIVYWGESGTGKTKTAFERYPDAFVMGPENGNWWDGYHGQPTILLDEYRDNFTFPYLLRLLDRYPMRVQCKGSYANFVATTIVITCPDHPRDWYSTTYEDKDQLLRRITEIIQFLPENSPPQD